MLFLISVLAFFVCSFGGGGFSLICVYLIQPREDFINGEISKGSQSRWESPSPGWREHEQSFGKLPPNIAAHRGDGGGAVALRCPGRGRL